MSLDNKNYLEELFIKEAKPALNRHSGSGGGSGGHIKKLLDSKSPPTCFTDNSNLTDLTSILEYEDTSNVDDMTVMFSSCSSLTTIPPLDTSKVTAMTAMFSGCSSLTTIPPLDTSKVIRMQQMFKNCFQLTTIPPLDTSKAENISEIFNGCRSLTTIQSLDTSNVYDMSGMFNSCISLREIRIKNIKCNLQVGSGSFWGHLLTLDSLIGLCKECIDMGSLNTLTVGTANLEKLASVYVKLVTDDGSGKVPFEVCESTDEGAILISEYMVAKNWQLA